MATLGEALLLLHGARDRFQTIRATVRERNREDLRRVALHRYATRVRRGELQAAPGVAVASGGGAREAVKPEVRESVTRLWWASPKLVRIERRDGFAVVNGAKSWSWSPEYGATEHEGSAVALLDLQPMLDPSVLLPAFNFTEAGETQVAGRPALLLRATARPSSIHGGGPMFAFAADHVLLAADRERGVLLRQAAVLDGTEFRVTELTEVAFDIDFEADTFVFEPPPGEVIRRADELPRARPATLEQAAGEADFVVLAPGIVPDGAVLSVQFMPAGDRPPQPCEVSLHYSLADDRQHLTVSERASRQPGTRQDQGKVRLVVGERELFLFEPDPRQVDHMQRQVWFDQDGTEVHINTSLARETLLAMATSFERVQADGG